MHNDARLEQLNKNCSVIQYTSIHFWDIKYLWILHKTDVPIVNLNCTDQGFTTLWTGYMYVKINKSVSIKMKMKW